jgi:hypothetical protein
MLELRCLATIRLWHCHSQLRETGTTDEFRDNWAMIYTPDLAVGVWVGNADNSPMVNTTGLTGAAPIWHDFMVQAIDKIKGGNPTPFYRPADIVDRIICTVSGTEPSGSCPSQRGEVFAADQPPLPASQDLWAKVMVDTWTNLRASSMCSNFTKEMEVINVTDPSARSWLTQSDQGRAWAEEMGFNTLWWLPPTGNAQRAIRAPCWLSHPPRANDYQQSIGYFRPGGCPADFSVFRLEWGLGDKPEAWYLLERRNTPVTQPEKYIPGICWQSLKILLPQQA